MGKRKTVKLANSLFQNYFIVYCVMASCILFGRPTSSHLEEKYDTPYFPWFVTGPLIAPTPVNMQIGHPAIEPILVVSCSYGSYDEKWNLSNTPKTWSVNPSVDFQFALTDRLGVEIYPAFITNYQGNKSASNFQDTNVFIGYQISQSQAHSWVPNFRTDLHLVFPSGNYQRLNPKLNEIDSTGQGSYQLGPTLIAEKLFYFDSHYLSLVWSLGYLWGFPSKVQGYNSYGGCETTDGKARPGNTILFFFSGEFSLTQRLSLANDLAIIHQGSSSFSGEKGIYSNGSSPKVKLKASTQISITPSIEYDFQNNLGILVGSWLSVAGINTEAFASVFAALVYVF